MTTRHQLLIHEDIPYTSHNSSMCFILEKAGEDVFESVIQIATQVIRKNMAEGSDPGLCVVLDPTKEAVSDLCCFGMDAKTRVLNKEEAYGLARLLKIHLSEHGGTGVGVIGALAGVGLRLSGNDGEVKGGLKDIKDGSYRVSDLLARPDVDRIVTVGEGTVISDGDVHFPKKSKSILRKGTYTLLVTEDASGYKALGKRVIRQMETLGYMSLEGDAMAAGCHKFEADVAEEQLDAEENCHNCRHRRWESKGYACSKGL